MENDRLPLLDVAAIAGISPAALGQWVGRGQAPVGHRGRVGNSPARLVDRAEGLMVAVLVALQGARRTVAETAGLARAVLEGVAELGAEADRAELLQVVIPPGEAPILIRSGAELLAFVGKAAAAGVTGWDTVDVRALHRRFLEGWAAAQARRAGAGEAVRVTGNGSVAIACEPGPDPLPASSPATRRAASARAAS